MSKSILGLIVMSAKAATLINGRRSMAVSPILFDIGFSSAFSPVAEIKAGSDRHTRYKVSVFGRNA